MSFTAKSVILDIADNWGNATHIGLRSVDFWYDGTKISLAATDFTAYATSEHSSSYHAENVFVTSLSKTGSHLHTEWLTNASTTNQRLIVVFDSSQTFDEIRINNRHSSGDYTNVGSKNVVIHYSTDSITSTTYEASISNSTKIFDGQFDEHSAVNEEDEQTLTLIGPTDLTSTNIETSPAVISSPSSISEDHRFNNFKLTKIGVEDSTWLGTWAYRIPLTIDSTKIDSDLTHFPVPIVLTGTDAEAVITELGSNSKKISVINSSGTELYCEIEQWDTVNDKICIWVSRSTWVLSSTEDEIIYLYYDSTQVDNTTYVGDPGDTVAQNVWNSDFAARYGMAQDPSGGADCIKDSTVNAIHGTPGGSMTSADLIDGEIGKAIEFDGVDDVIELVGDDLSDFSFIQNTMVFTIEVIGKLNDLEARQSFLGSASSSANKGIDYKWETYDPGYGDHALRCFLVKGSGLGVIDGHSENNESISDNDFHCTVAKAGAPGANLEFWIDAVQSTTSYRVSYSGLSTGNSDRTLMLGAFNNGSAPAAFLNGVISEVRISTVDRSDDWIKADYHAQTNTLLTVGSSEVPTVSNFSYWKDRPSNRWKNYTAIYIEGGLPVLLITEPYGNRPTPTDIMNLEYGIKLGVDLEEQFGLKLAGEFNEDYSITQTITQEIEETYGIKLTLDVMEWYGNAPVRRKVFNEYYDDARVVKKVLVLRYKDASIPILWTNEMYSDIPYVVSVIWEIYNDAPQALKMLEEKYKDAHQSKQAITLRYNDSLTAKSYYVETYDTVGAIQLIINEKYSISGVQATQTYPEIYNLDALNKISKPFEEKYYILPDSPDASNVNASITVDGTEIDFISLSIDISIDTFAILGTIQLATEEDYLLCKYMSDVVCSIEGTDFVFFLENKTRTVEHSSGISYVIQVVSPTVKLDAPYSNSIIESFPDGVNAEALVNQMADLQSVSVDYQILDWNIPGYAISINNETPLNVIRRVVNAAGAVLQTKPDGTLLVISKYETSPKDWNDYEPTEIVSSTDEITYFSETLQINNQNNAFLVTDQGASTSDITLQEIDVDNNTKIIKGFRIPFEDGPFELETSGGPLVNIDKFTNPVEEAVPIADLDGTVNQEWEYVEFIDWVGSTSYPIYELIDSDWEKDDLGAFQISEEGTLTIINQDAVPSESLLRIKYMTKYWKWTVTGVEGSHVQFYVPEEV